MKKLTMAGIVLVLLAGASLLAINAAARPKVDAATTGTPVAVAQQSLAASGSGQIVANAVVVPLQTAELWFDVQGGVVTEVLVHEGDSVTSGTPLLRLDTRELQLRVDQAEAVLASAQASYDQLQAGPRPEDIAQAQARVSLAKAQLRQIEGTVTGQTVAAGQARLEQARASLERLLAGPTKAELAAAQANVDRQKADLQSTRDRLSAAKTDAQLSMEQAANELDNRNDAYSVLVQQLEQRRTRVGAQEQLNAAKRAVENAEKALQQALVDYDEARQAEVTGVQSAEAQVRQAQAQLDQLLAGADPDQVAAARAAVAQAQDELSQLQGDQRAGALEAAEAAVVEAEAALERLMTTPRPSDLQIAAARVQEAQVMVKEAELALDKATLRAPIDGTVASINARVGERPRQDMPVLVLADLSAWRIQTANLSELNVGRIQEGDPATITFSALPDLQLTGTVSSIKPLGTNLTGEITTYTVLVTPDTFERRLRWNMTGSITIRPAP